jgi:hypothetical protein
LIKTKTQFLTGVLALTCMAAHAALPSDEAVVGQMLDASGVTMKSFQPKALPLPAGNWKIVGRTEDQIKLTGNGPDSVPQITLTLENQDKDSLLVAALVTYTPEQVGIRWNGNSSCQTMGAKANWINDFGKTTGSLIYACTNDYVYLSPRTLKNYLQGIGESKNQWFKTRLTPLAANAANFDFGYNWLWGSFNKDKGRSLVVTFISKIPADFKAGDATETRLKEWGAQMGEAYIDWLDGGQKTIPALDSK